MSAGRGEWGRGAAPSVGLGVPRFGGALVWGCPGSRVPRFGVQGPAGLDGAVSPPCFGANVASTPPPPPPCLLFFRQIVQPAATFLGVWPVPYVSPCPIPSPGHLGTAGTAAPAAMHRRARGDTCHVPGGRSSPQPPRGHSSCPTGDEGRWHPSGGHSTPGTAASGALGTLGTAWDVCPTLGPTPQPDPRGARLSHRPQRKRSLPGQKTPRPVPLRHRPRTPQPRQHRGCRGPQA